MPVRQQKRRSQWDSIYMDGKVSIYLPLPMQFSISHACLYMHTIFKAFFFF